MKDIKNLKIAYIGGGSRAWARNLFNDLAKEESICGEVHLYDIDYEAAAQNAIIGNNISALPEAKSKWKYMAIDSLDKALKGSDFVVISILPGTFDEMESDVHAPEKYGVYQTVGDTVGPGGIVRALRTIPMFKAIAEGVKKNCPNAWVINYTNPMTLCVRTLYEVFPEIKAFGCCHEVFGTQKVLAHVLEEKTGIKVDREEIKCNVSGVNHFTWITEARYKDMDLFPLYKEYIDEHPEGWQEGDKQHWINSVFACANLVKFDLFKRFGVIAAAGDRHLAEFCPGKWYLESETKVKEWGFALTPVSWRKENLQKSLNLTQEYLNGKKFELFNSGEEGVRQIKALLGIGDFVTNVNIPNVGQAVGLPIGAVVETNAYFSGDSVKPLMAGKLPDAVQTLVSRVVYEQECVLRAGLDGDYELAFEAFANDANMGLPIDKARELFNTMLYNTRKYLPAYEKYAKAQGLAE